ncbi:MAG: DUF4382 domain-containing protein [Gemmatimonadetes bacterium]|nr:DUF4382 domain-containing protein [Gemmatimonadota bacterium]
MNRELFAAPRTLLLGLLALVPLVGACKDRTSAENEAMVQIQLTDAAADYIQTAKVWISKVYLHGGPGHAADTTDAETNGSVYLFNNAARPFQVDLLTLSSGAIKNLTDSVAIPAGNYKQLRIVVDSAKVTLKAGFKFEDGTTTRTLKIPSGSSSGIKVKLPKDLGSEIGSLTVLLADFDLDESLKIQLSSQAANTLKSISLDPVIKDKSRASHSHGKKG